MFRYRKDDIESTVVLDWAIIASMGVSLGLMTSRLHSSVRSSRYWKYLTLSLAKFNSVAMRLGSDRYRIDSLQVVANSGKTSSVMSVSVKLRNDMFGQVLVSALTLLSRTLSVARFIFSTVLDR